MAKSNTHQKRIHKSEHAVSAPESDYLYVAESRIQQAGKGLFTAVTLFKDEIIAVFIGEVISTAIFETRSKKGEHSYFMNLPNGKTLDCGKTDCFAKYANDVVGTAYKTNAFIGMDEYGNVCLIAAKKINPSSEIYCSYGKAYWELRDPSLYK